MYKDTYISLFVLSVGSNCMWNRSDHRPHFSAIGQYGNWGWRARLIGDSPRIAMECAECVTSSKLL